MTTTATKPTTTDAAVLKQFFGLREGQTLTGFVAELKDLSADEKAQLANGIRDETFTY